MCEQAEEEHMLDIIPLPEITRALHAELVLRPTSTHSHKSDQSTSSLMTANQAHRSYDTQIVSRDSPVRIEE